MFGYVLLDKNFAWYQELMLSVVSDPMRVSKINPKNCIGALVLSQPFFFFSCFVLRLNFDLLFFILIFD